MRLPPPPVIRTAGLPPRVLDAIRFPAVAALVDELLAQREWLAREGEELSAELHDAIATLPGDGSLKPRLVGLRRAVYRSRRPARAEWESAFLTDLPAGLRGRLRDWRRALERHHACSARAPEVLAEETARRGQALLSAAADPGFRRALWLSSASLSAELDSWLAGRRSPDRSGLFRIAKYLSRAATKTSPFSTFTLSGFGSWAPAGAAVTLARDSAPRGVTELRWPVREPAWRQLAREPEAWDSLLVRVNPSAVLDRRRLSFLGRPPAEPLLRLPVTAAVQECLRLAGNGQPVRFGVLRDRLVAGGGEPGAAGVARFLTHLIEVGLLELQPPAGTAGSTASSSLAALARWTARHGRPGVRRAAHLLSTIDSQVREPVPVADLAGHRRRLTTLRRAVTELGEQLGAGDLAGSGASITQDTAVLTGVAGSCAEPAWRPVLADLQVIRAWLGLFNPMLALRVAVAELLAARVPTGATVPFLGFHRMIQEEIAASGPAGAEVQRLLTAGPGQAAEPRDPRSAWLRNLAWLRERALDPFQRPSPPAGPDPVIQVDVRELRDQLASWPSWVRAPLSIGCYLQPLPGPDGLSVVLNAVDSGCGRGRSRLAHLVRRAGGQPPVDLPARRAAAGPPVLAELGQLGGWSLDDRLPSLPYEIDYPYAVPGRPPGQRLPLNDLVVSRDPDRGLLRLASTRLGAEVRVLHLGMAMQQLLPPAARLLTWLFGDFLPVSPAVVIGGSIRVEADRPPAAPATAGVECLPRMVVGRVVLHRARWWTASEQIPTRTPGEPDLGFLLRLAGWRRAYGIPERCFVRALPRHSAPATGAPPGKQRKPVYIDFASWFLVLAFENMVKPGTVVVLEEALPDPALATSLAAPETPAPRVMELLVEVSQECP